MELAGAAATAFRAGSEWDDDPGSAIHVGAGGRRGDSVFMAGGDNDHGGEFIPQGGALAVTGR